MTTTSGRTQTLAAQLSALLKAAAAKASADDQGSTDTSHPSASVDNGTQAATEGARSAENSADVKKQVGDATTDSASPTKLDGASANPMTTAKPVGEDPAVETASVASKPDADETSHPATADFGEKYSSFRKRANAFLVRVAAATETVVSKTAAEACADTASKKVPVETEMVEEKAAKEAAAAGAQAANAILGQVGSNVDAGGPVIMEVVKTACDDANRLISFYKGLADAAAAKETAQTKAAQTKTVQPKVAKPAASKIAAHIAKRVMQNKRAADTEAGAEDIAANSSSDGGEASKSPPKSESAPSSGSEPSIKTETNGSAGATITEADVAMIVEGILSALMAGGDGGVPVGDPMAGGAEAGAGEDTATALMAGAMGGAGDMGAAGAEGGMGVPAAGMA